MNKNVQENTQNEACFRLWLVKVTWYRRGYGPDVECVAITHQPSTWPLCLSTTLCSCCCTSYRSSSTPGTSAPLTTRSSASCTRSSTSSHSISLRCLFLASPSNDLLPSAIRTRYALHACCPVCIITVILNNSHSVRSRSVPMHPAIWRGRDKTVLSCPRRRCEQAISKSSINLATAILHKSAKLWYYSECRNFQSLRAQHI